jgi:hypothetical protein
MHLLLGSDALKSIRDKLNSLGEGDRHMGIGHRKISFPFSSNTNTKFERQSSPALLNSAAMTLA